MSDPIEHCQERGASHCAECGTIANAYVLLFDKGSLSRKVCLACHSHRAVLSAKGGLPETELSAQRQLRHAPPGSATRPAGEGRGSLLRSFSTSKGRRGKLVKRIMTVDDSPTFRQMLSLTLRGAGYEVLEAADGQEAIDQLNRGEEIDMLITDLHMPHVNGLDLIQRVRSDVANRFLPILMLTCESHEEPKRQGRRVGASGWMVKPFQPEQLLGMVRMVMP